MSTRKLVSNNPEDEYKDHYHGHPKYLNIFILLLVFMTLTLIPDIVNTISGKVVVEKIWWIIALIFVFSTWKAVLVMRNFMHVRYEPKLVFIMVATALACLVLLFALVSRDIPAHDNNTTLTITSGKDGNGYFYMKNGERTPININAIKEKLHPKH